MSTNIVHFPGTRPPEGDEQTASDAFRKHHWYVPCIASCRYALIPQSRDADGWLQDDGQYQCANPEAELYAEHLRGQCIEHCAKFKVRLELLNR